MLCFHEEITFVKVSILPFIMFYGQIVRELFNDFIVLWLSIYLLTSDSGSKVFFSYILYGQIVGETFIFGDFGS